MRQGASGMNINRPILISGLWLAAVGVVAWLIDTYAIYMAFSWLLVLIGGLTAGMIYLWLRTQQQRRDEHEQLRQSEQRFMERLHHQMKNHLQIIQLGLTNLNNSVPQEQERLKRLQVHAERISQMIKGLHQLYRLDEYVLTGKKVDLFSLLEKEADLTQQTTGRKIELQLQLIPWRLRPIYGNEELLRQAVGNVLENAAKYLRNPDSLIILYAKDDGKTATIDIRDEGIGIPPDELPQIQAGEPLFRGTNTGEIPGSGLGLALVKRIMELHGGKMTLSSQVDKGTVVSLYLPVIKEP